MFTPEDFRAELNANGVVKSNRYLVTFSAPSDLKATYGDTKFLTLRANSAQLPGFVLATMEGFPRYGYGANELNPYGVIWDDSAMTFVLDTGSKVHNFFYDWMNVIVNTVAKGQTALAQSGLSKVAAALPYEVNYKDSYVVDITIDVYSGVADSESGEDTPIMTYTLYRAFPKNMPQLNLAWENTNQVINFPVTFSYTDYSIKYPS